MAARRGWIVGLAASALVIPPLVLAEPREVRPASAEATAVAHGLRAWHGDRKPGFVLKDTGGRTHSLEQYGGRPLLVHFFATWCEPCRPEMQALERFVAREGFGAFRVLALSVNEPAGRVRRFFESTPVSFPILLDLDREVAKAWGVQILPTTYLLDADLAPRLFMDRDLEWDRLDIAPILAAVSRRDGGPPDVRANPSTTTSQGGH